MIVRMQQQSRVSAALLVNFPNPAKIDVHHRVAVEHDKLLGKRIETRQNCARGAERLLLDDVFDRNAPLLSRAKMRLDPLGLIKRKNQNVREAMSSRQFDLVFEQRFTSDWDHRLRQIAQPRLEPRAEPA